MSNVTLPNLPQGYFWEVLSHLHSEKIARNEIQVKLCRTRRGLLRHRTVLATECLTFKKAKKRDHKIEKAAAGIWATEQQVIYRDTQLAHARDMAAEDYRRSRLSL